MAKKAKDTTAQDTAVADPTNSTEPTPNSSPLDEAQANPNAATGDESDNTNTNEAPAPDDVNDPEVQASQPEEAPADVAPNPDTEATLTAANGPSEPVPAGSADATADASADGQHNDTENTHPQSRLHSVEVELTEKDRLAIHEESNQDGAVVAVIAEKWGVTPEQVTAIVDEVNANADRSGQGEDSE